MTNRIFILLMVLALAGCNDGQNANPCTLESTPMGNFIVFADFNKDTVNKIVLNNKNTGYKSVINKPVLEDNGNGELRLKLNPDAIAIVQNGFVIVINDSIKYRISDLQISRSQKATMWHKKMFCELRSYKLNDSLIHKNYLLVNACLGKPLPTLNKATQVTAVTSAKSSKTNDAPYNGK